MARGKGKQSKKDKQGGEMKEEKSVFHEIGKGGMEKKDETDPFYMEETERENDR